ncbi:MAG: ATP-binding protein [Myxococcota bacterium]
MKLPAPTIRLKIALPFTLLFAAAGVLVAYVSVSLISTTLDRRLESQIEEASEMISQTGFALNPAIVQNLKAVVGAEIVTYRRDGDVIVSTLGPGLPERMLEQEILTADIAYLIFAMGHPLVMRSARVRGETFRIAYRPVRSPPGTVLAMAFSTSDIAETRAAIARSIGVITVFAIASMALLSVLIARSITSPITRLVEFTGRLAAGDLSHTAEVETADEVGQLVTAFNEMVERLRASEQELLHSEKLAVTGQLAARVAHDIRNPLSAIKMRAQMLRNKLQPESGGGESLEAILREIDRVERVVEGLLDLSRPGELALQTGDANDVMEEALRAIAPTLAHRKVEVVRQLDPDLPPARFDEDRLINALLNLVANAADAMPEGGELVVASGASDDASSLYLEIRDHGPGIEAEHLERLFDPFFTTKREGVGLGLLNARSIVERHGGRLELQPAEPTGTRARIVLPVAGRPRVA